jgi:hypothetical protein
LEQSTEVVARKTSNFISVEQEKTGLEILSKICSGNFPTVLDIIANEERTVAKIKMEFEKLTSLVKIKRNLIEPIFIALAKYNSEMGDWMIKQMLSYDNFEDLATLTANLIMSQVEEMPARINMLQDHLVSAIKQPGFLYT